MVPLFSVLLSAIIASSCRNRCTFSSNSVLLVLLLENSICDAGFVPV
jgi:hypothetical protein